MSKSKIICTIFIALLSVSSISLITPNVSARPIAQIILPFSTSWENGDPIGMHDSVDFMKDFMQSELGYTNNIMTPPQVFGYDFGSRQLLAEGFFGSSYSYCYFNLFDQTSGCDWGPPFVLKPHTFINIWYFHRYVRDCMIDAQIFNKRTGQWWTLRDFSYAGKYIVDQNNVRLHPACRSGDPLLSWQFACFDLSEIWNSDPGNWIVTKMWIAFDNGNSHALGVASTYFDMLYISYGTGGATTSINYLSGSPDPWTHGGYVSGSIVPMAYYKLSGYYYLLAKVAVTGTRFHVDSTPIGYQYPFKLSVSVGRSNAQVQNAPKPTGINLTAPDPASPAGTVQEFLYDLEMTIVSDLLPLGWVLDAELLAQQAFGLLSQPGQQPTYTWPEAITYFNWWADPQMWGVTFAQGEAYLCIPMLAPGSYSIPITFKVEYYFYTVNQWFHCNDGSLTVNLDWNTEPTLPLLTVDPRDQDGGMVPTEVWIDNGAPVGEPWTVRRIYVSPGVHTIRVEDEIYVGPRLPCMKYSFQRWSDGVTDNPRTVNIQWDVTYTPIYWSHIAYKKL